MFGIDWLKKRKSPAVDTAICLGCGVCGLKCPIGSIELVKRRQKVLHPEDMFERVILQFLERGTLQNLIFDNPQSTGQQFIRIFVGAFLKLPRVKKALMNDALRSQFLRTAKQRATLN